MLLDGCKKVKARMADRMDILCSGIVWLNPFRVSDKSAVGNPQP